MILCLPVAAQQTDILHYNGLTMYLATPTVPPDLGQILAEYRIDVEHLETIEPFLQNALLLSELATDQVVVVDAYGTYADPEEGGCLLTVEVEADVLNDDARLTLETSGSEFLITITRFLEGGPEVVEAEYHVLEVTDVIGGDGAPPQYYYIKSLRYLTCTCGAITQSR
jgi:hypothetical protein